MSGENASDRHDCDKHDRDGDYGLLADVIGEAFNPPGDDVAEESILVDAVYRARDWIDGQPCRCTPDSLADHVACGRCYALGRLGDKPVDR